MRNGQHYRWNGGLDCSVATTLVTWSEAFPTARTRLLNVHVGQHTILLENVHLPTHWWIAWSMCWNKNTSQYCSPCCSVPQKSVELSLDLEVTPVSICRSYAKKFHLLSHIAWLRRHVKLSPVCNKETANNCHASMSRLIGPPCATSIGEIKFIIMKCYATNVLWPIIMPAIKWIRNCLLWHVYTQSSWARVASP